MEEQKSNYSAGGLWHILKESAKRLAKNNPLHLAGATAFFATFSLAPLFFIIIQLLGGIIGKSETRQNIIQKFAENAPEESTKQFKQFMDGLQQLGGAWYVDVGLFLFLLFSASRLFILIRISFYQLWRLKHVGKERLKFKIRNYFLPVALIITAGALLLAGLLGESLRSLLGEAVVEISPSLSKYFHSIFRYLVSMVVAWAWFAVIFRYLTDARPQWKTVLVGALFTSVLFNLGKLILQPSLSMGKIHAVFGTSASLVLLQLFVFYISLLIYYGAAFTMEWARHYKQTVYIPDYLGYYTLEEKHTKEDSELEA